MKTKLLTIALNSLIVAPLFAQSSDGNKNATVIIPEPPSNGWQHSVAPYLWMPGIKGQVGVNGVVSDVDASFGDILSDLDFGGFVGFSGKKNKWGYFVDIEYLKLTSDASIDALPIDKVKMSMQELRVEAVLSYQIYQTEQTSLDLYAGVQLTYLDIDIDATAANGAKNGTGGSESWADPIIGFKLLHDFNEKWYSVLVGEVGGFSVSSDLTWQAMAGVGYNINECWSIVGGYRHLYIDYSNGDFLFNVDESGPILGGVYKF